jgi:23S rRNA (pseudouridine1915-N3)-methyltransferase
MQLFEYCVHQSRYQPLPHAKVMGRIFLHLHGHIKEKALKSLFESYVRRLEAKHLRVEVTSDKVPTKDYVKALSSLEGRKYFLDESGASHTSVTFADEIKQSSLRTENTHFCIGPVDGWSGTLDEYNHTISLSQMTFTHEFAAVLLVEQIYRAFEIMRGSEYHRM